MSSKDPMIECARAIGDTPIFDDLETTLRDMFDDVGRHTTDWNDDMFIAIMQRFARACLIALSENVSEKMEDAGMKEYGYSMFCGDHVRNVFTAMITAAMGEK